MIVDPSVTEWRDRKNTVTFDAWLEKCDELWDTVRGESASENPHLPWHDWYRRGFTVEYAIELAEAEIFEHEARPWDLYLTSIGWDDSE